MCYIEVRMCSNVIEVSVLYRLCAKYGFGPSEDFAAQTSDPSFAQ